MPEYQSQRSKGGTADFATQTNAAAVVTYALVAGKSHYIEEVVAGFSAAPGAGATLKVEDGSGTIIWQVPLPAAILNPLRLPVRKRGTVGTAMIVTLSAGGAGVVGFVNVIDHTTD